HISNACLLSSPRLTNPRGTTLSITSQGCTYRAASLLRIHNRAFTFRLVSLFRLLPFLPSYNFRDKGSLCIKLVPESQTLGESKNLSSVADKVSGMAVEFFLVRETILLRRCRKLQIELRQWKDEESRACAENRQLESMPIEEANKYARNITRRTVCYRGARRGRGLSWCSSPTGRNVTLSQEGKKGTYSKCGYRHRTNIFLSVTRPSRVCVNIKMDCSVISKVDLISSEPYQIIVLSEVWIYDDKVNKQIYCSRLPVVSTMTTLKSIQRCCGLCVGLNICQT
ncbi:hypothetical protein J6590_065068, partial [Homalodisca vitripennis]